VSYTLVAGLEWALPHRSEWRRPQGDVRADLTHLLVTGPGASQLGMSIVSGLAVVCTTWLSGRLGAGLWPSDLPVAAQLLLAILVAELGHYWFHRLSHENAWVWRLHAVHHSAPRLYWLNATRFHPLDLVCLVVFQALPLVLLGIPPRVFLLYAIAQACYGQLQHGNIDLRTGPARWLFSTPELHRWHHSTDAREGNNNYGAILITWDLVFGTYFWPRDRRFAGPVGIAGMPRFPTTWTGQVLAPFRWTAIS
jgi:sterol desaturase/sphingolipid hydroxylase (fatty acid hydroxylase superfamily)